MCRKNGLPTEGKKHELLKFLVDKEGLELPPDLELYDGELASLPYTVTDISKLSIFKLREVLRFHNILDCGTKDELALRVGMLLANRSYLAFHKELQGLRDLVAATRTLIRNEKQFYLKISPIKNECTQHHLLPA